MADGGSALQLKTCTKCGEAKQLSEFNVVNRKYLTKCKVCSREYKREWRFSRSSELREKESRQAKKYRAANIERISNLRREYYEKSKGKFLLAKAKNRAKRKCLPFGLTLEWITPRLEAGVCELTGLPFSKDGKGKSWFGPFVPTIDRRDSSKGYTEDNCRLVCWAINMALGEWGDETYALVAKSYLENRR